jgi:hypothetical protein
VDAITDVVSAHRFDASVARATTARARAPAREPEGLLRVVVSVVVWTRARAREGVAVDASARDIARSSARGAARVEGRRVGVRRGRE